MPDNPREMITVAERRFPVRIRVAAPRAGLGQRHTQITRLARRKLRRGRLGHYPIRDARRGE
jgi:hypothetical protein